MSKIDLLRQIKDFNKNYCYQYQRRVDTLQEDLEAYNWTEEDIKNINLSDFTFSYIQTEEEKKEAIAFIQRYEWLGTIGSFPTHWFKATYKDKIGGIIIFSMPNAFSKLLGEETKNIERLISRGASASWTPFNLGSKFLMWAIKWMVENTQYRLFTAYSDPQAKELGSIYQALNFYYLGQKHGTTKRCINPFNKDVIVSDRAFRSRSFYKRYAKELNIEWQPNWNNSQSILWENIPDDVEKQLRDYSKKMYKEAIKIDFPNKHKYAFVLGRNKKETKALREKFINNNKIYPYPKER